MDKVSELKKILSETLVWNKARLDCFARMLLALFAVRTVNLSEIAVAFASKSKKDSRYKRLQGLKIVSFDMGSILYGILL